MVPLLTFATGLVIGIAGVRLLRSATLDASATPSADDIGQKARQGFDRGRSGLREAAVSGLTAVERTSAGLREKLAPEPSAQPPATAEAEAPAEAPPAAKPKARRPPRKAAKKAPEAAP